MCAAPRRVAWRPSQDHLETAASHYARYTDVIMKVAAPLDLLQGAVRVAGPPSPSSPPIPSCLEQYCIYGPRSTTALARPPEAVGHIMAVSCALDNRRRLPPMILANEVNSARTAANKLKERSAGISDRVELVM